MPSAIPIKYIITTGAQISSSLDLESKNSRAIKGAPLESLFAQFCLQSLWFGNCNVRGSYVSQLNFFSQFLFIVHAQYYVLSWA